MTPFTKDWYLLVRDRSRLVTLVALPVIFIGIQIFGSVGWSWTTAHASAHRRARYSLAAYMATFGPLGHMEAERAAFWLLRVAPVSLGRLLAWKALFWSAIVGGAAGVWATACSRGALPLTLDGWDWSRWRCWARWRRLVGGGDGGGGGRTVRYSVGRWDGTVYLFLLVAGLFNVVLLESGEVRLRALGLYVAAVALCWVTGVQRAEDAYDPESRRIRTATPGAGATFAILLLLGTRAQRLAFGAAEVRSPNPSGRCSWPPPRHLSPSSPQPRRPLVLAAFAGRAALAIAGLPMMVTGRAGHPSSLPLLVALAHAAVEELGIRGVVQPSLAARGRTLVSPSQPGRAGRLRGRRTTLRPRRRCSSRSCPA